MAVAGLYFGNVTVKYEAYMSLKVRTSVFNFWEIIGFLANSANLSLFRRKYECCKHRSKYRFDNFGIWRRIYCENNIYLSDFVSINRFTREKIPTAWRHIVVLGGMRGASRLPWLLRYLRGYKWSRLKDLIVTRPSV